MAERIKMSRLERAKQFAPFDALKGLQDILRLKEFEHDKIAKNEMSEDSIKEISETLSQLNKNDEVEIEFFQNGHSYKLVGKSQIDILNQQIIVGNFVILFDEIKNIKSKKMHN